MRRPFWRWARHAVPLALLIAACSTNRPPPQAPATAARAMRLEPARFADLPGWLMDDPVPPLHSFRASCRRMATMPADQRLGGTGDSERLGGTPAAWRRVCKAADEVAQGDPEAARRFWETSFQPWRVVDVASGPEGLFTGYYEPLVPGSRVRAPGYATPLLARPLDIVQIDLGRFDESLQGRRLSGRVENGVLVPYWDRAAIEAGALRGRQLELFWLADPFDAFLLQVQGSGRVALPDGRQVRISYDGQNGRPYVPIGRVLIERGALARGHVTMPAIRTWLAAHPDQAAEVMNQNPSFVFFREIEGVGADEGPPGALGVSLTPGRSLAVDRHFLPLGAPVFVATTDPLTGMPFRRLMQAQDIGGAIQGPVRGDIFWGWGNEPEARAGLMQAQGSDWILLPRPPGAIAAR